MNVTMAALVKAAGCLPECGASVEFDGASRMMRVKHNDPFTPGDVFDLEVAQSALAADPQLITKMLKAFHAEPGYDEA